MQSPWLSVIVPTYNGAAYLAAALTSLSEQCDAGVECIVIDDGSTDDTIEIIESFRGRIPLRLHKGARKGNWVAGTNLGLSLASGEYACFLHQDDLWLPGRLAVMKKLAQEHPDASLLFSSAIFVDLDGRRMGGWRSPLPQGELDPVLLQSRLLVQNFIAIPSPVFKRSAALDAGGLDESLWYSADWDLWLKLAKLKAVFTPEVLVAFRIHGESQTVTRSFDSGGFRQQLETVFLRHLETLQGGERSRERVKALGLCSIEVNTALAAKMHGNSIDLVRLVQSFAGLGPVGWWQYLRYSRIRERVVARLRTRIF